MRSPSTVLITGASSGIGRALAIEYGRRSAHVIVVARRETELASACEEIEKAGGRASRIVCDVADAEAAHAMVGDANAKFGPLDMVVANAGKGVERHASEVRLEDVKGMIGLNVIGAIATLAAAIPIFVERKRGHLVGVSSLAGRRALPGSSLYSASKAALSTFLEGARLDLAPSGIGVTDVQPGFVATPAVANATHPRPFQWSSDRAAKAIADRLQRAPGIIAFPWPLALGSRLGQLLPFWLYAAMTRRMSGRH